MANQEFIKNQMERIEKQKEKTPTIVKIKKRGNYVAIDNAILQDENLSWKAKGILVYCLSKPPDWQIYLTELIKHSPDRKTSTRTGFNELEKHFYLYREKRRVPKTGHFKGWIYWIFEDPTEHPNYPKGQKPDVGKPDVGKSDVGKSATSNKER